MDYCMPRVQYFFYSGQLPNMCKVEDYMITHAFNTSCNGLDWFHWLGQKNQYWSDVMVWILKQPKIEVDEK